LQVHAQRLHNFTLAFLSFPVRWWGLESPLSFRIAYLLVFLAGALNAWRRWTDYVFKSDDERRPKRFTLKWTLRPSNLLMLVSVSSFMFWGLRQEFAASGYLFALSWISMGAALLVRHWEDKSLKP
jgi:hypothetical protein